MAKAGVAATHPRTEAITVADTPTMTTRRIRWAWQGRDLSLSVDEAGEGPAVLLLPALSSISTRREMHLLMHRLAHRAQVIVPDWPGFGDQPRPAIVWTPDALSAFLAQFVEREVPPLHATVAAGHAATYALFLAARSPSVLGRLVLLAPTWRGPLPTMAGGQRPWFHQIRRMVGTPVIGPVLYRLNVNRLVVRMMMAGHVYSDAQALPAATWEAKQAVIRAPGARFASAAFVTGGLDRVHDREAFLDLARSVEAPRLLAYATGTPPKSRAEMEALASLPGVQSAVTARGKLAFYEEYADDVYPVIDSFIFP
jgi:pimeloyl-ACP methyl ester carboxylesterase